MLPQIINGALISGSLIIAIGAQNVFVIKQGILRNHIFWVCFICFCADFCLMLVGVLGVGTFISKNILISKILALSGALFLLWYSFHSFKNVYRTKKTNSTEFNPFTNTKQQNVIVATLAVTFLNPHVYLDTVVIVGGIAGTLSLDQKFAFLIGAVMVSFVWFFGIGYGAKLLSPYFKNRTIWLIIDSIVGCVMLYIASLLIFYTVNV